MSRGNSDFSQTSWEHGVVAQWAKGGNGGGRGKDKGDNGDGDTGDGSSGGPLDGHEVSSYGSSGSRGRGNNKSTGTGDPGIDSLTYGVKWDGSLGSGAELTYSFGTSSSVYMPDYPYGAL